MTTPVSRGLIWTLQRLAAFLPLVLGPVAAQDLSITLTTVDFPPFRIIEGAEAPTGTDIEVAEAVFTDLGYRVRWEVMPFKRAIEGLKTGEVFAWVNLTRNPERDGFLIFSDPISTTSNVFFKRRDRSISWSRLEDLKSFTIGASDYNYGPEFAAATFLTLEKAAGETPELTHLKKLAAGRLDLVICEIAVCGWLIRNHADLGALDYIDRPVGRVNEFRIGFSRARSESGLVQSRFNRGLAAYIAAGKRTELFRKYGLTPPP